ncbi:MAG: hypothetical protein AMXMBFR23_21440 [Chloroflexota bacterium]
MPSATPSTTPSATPPTGLALPATTADRADGALTARANALAFDLLAMAVATSVGGMLALGWIVVRTGGGTDPSAGDSALAFALLMAGLPAWYGLAAFDLVRGGSTPGLRRSGFRVEGGPARRLLSFALAPTALPGWGWLTAVAAISTVYPLALLLASMTVLVATASVASVALVLAGRTALHELATGTKVVRA